MSEGFFPAVQVRPARQDDVPALVEFNLRLARETEGRELRREVVEAGVAGLFARPSAGFYLAAESQSLAGSSGEHAPDSGASSVVGALLVTYEWSDWRCGWFWWLQSVYVLPEWRRRGVFRELLAAVRRQARQSPEVCGLRLYAEEHNQAALAAYAALGLAPRPYRVLEQTFE